MTFQPRGYQSDCVEANLQAWLKHQRFVNVLATGLGKTEIACMLMGQAKRSLFLVHRDELVQQTYKKLHERHGIYPDVEKAESFHDPAGTADVVASVQSCQHQRLARFRPEDFGRIIVDEAHHAVAPTYRKVLDYFPDANVVGFTATSNRTDEKALELVFERCDTPTGACFYMPIAKGTNDGWLVPLTCQEIVVKGLDLSKIKISRETGDFNQHDLARAMAEEGIIHEIAVPLLELAKGRQAIAFCAGVDEAVMLAEVLNKLTGDQNTAAPIHCNIKGRVRPDGSIKKSHLMPKAVRRSHIKRYKEGSIQILCNFGVLTEGFDAPNTQIIANARPTTSSLIVTQMLGRGTRPTVCQIALGAAQTPYERRQLIRQSDKPQCLVLDFKGRTASAVKLATCEDALGGEYDDEIKERAKRYRDNGRSITENLEFAAAESDLFNEMRADRSWFKPEVVYEAKTVDLYGGNSAPAPPAGPTGGAPATDKQRRYLWVLHKKAGVPWNEERARSWTKAQAGAIIHQFLSRNSSTTAATAGSNSGSKQAF